MREGPRIYNPESAARALSISKTSLYRLIAAGKLAAIKIDGIAGIRIRAEDLDAYIASGREISPGEIDDGLPPRSRSRARAVA